MEKCFDNKAFIHSPGDLSNTSFPWESEIGNRVTAGDCNWYVWYVKQDW